jgi:hypothetical protein
MRGLDPMLGEQIEQDRVRANHLSLEQHFQHPRGARG